MRGDDVAEMKKWGLTEKVEADPDFPFIVVSPQCHNGEIWTDVEALGAILDEVARTCRVDPDRVYVTGHSMGGRGALYAAYKMPARFAAIVALANELRSHRDSIGQLNPALYALAADPKRYSNDFHDITQGSNAIAPGLGFNAVSRKALQANQSATLPRSYWDWRDILDYFTPPGSSLAETNRILLHIEEILKSTPEVENPSRRTGMQLGLAAVTEANTGDLTVKLKQKRSRAVDEIIADVRSDIKKQEPALDVEFIQTLQDMISDLPGEPQPVEVKLFSPDQALLAEWAPKVGESIGKIPGVVDVLNGIDNTISGPAVMFQINPSVAARAGFTPEEIAVTTAALVEGEPSPIPVVANDHAYTLRVRFPDANRASIEALSSSTAQQHGSEAHDMVPTPEQVLAVATPVTGDAPADDGQDTVSGA